MKSDESKSRIKHNAITIASAGVTVAVIVGVLSYFDLFQLEAEPTALVLTPIDLAAGFLFIVFIVLGIRYLPRGGIR